MLFISTGVIRSLFEQFAHEFPSFLLRRRLFLFSINSQPKLTRKKPNNFARFSVAIYYLNTYTAARRFMQFRFYRSLLPLLLAVFNRLSFRRASMYACERACMCVCVSCPCLVLLYSHFQPIKCLLCRDLL